MWRASERTHGPLFLSLFPPLILEPYPAQGRRVKAAAAAAARLCFLFKHAFVWAHTHALRLSLSPSLFIIYFLSAICSLEGEAVRRRLHCIHVFICIYIQHFPLPPFSSCCHSDTSFWERERESTRCPRFFFSVCRSSPVCEVLESELSESSRSAVVDACVCERKRDGMGMKESRSLSTAFTVVIYQNYTRLQRNEFEIEKWKWTWKCAWPGHWTSLSLSLSLTHTERERKRL